MTKRKPRTYESPLRKAQADDTHQRIVEAAYELLKTTRPDELSYAVIADSTGITQRTIYRHFPERSDLVGAVARLHVAQYLGDEGLPVDPPGYARLLARFHEFLSQEPGAYRVMMAAPTRAEASAGTFYERTLGDVLARAPKDQRATMLGVWELLFSPYFWEVLHTHHGVAPARITRAALVMLALLHDALERDPALFDPTRPLPARYRDDAAGAARTPRRRTTTT